MQLAHEVAVAWIATDCATKVLVDLPSTIANHWVRESVMGYVSILDVGDGVVEVRATSGDGHLGGDDFDRRIVDHLAEEFQRDTGIDLRQDPQALQRLFEAAEKAKVELSSVTQTTINLPFITADASGPKHLNTTLSRATFEQITADLIERCLGPVQQAMAVAKVTADDIDEVILV